MYEETEWNFSQLSNMRRIEMKRVLVSFPVSNQPKT